jgi:small subunit ribosomal protein S2
MSEELLVTKQEYLASGIHIGMKSRTEDMKKFVYKVREDGLAVLNLKALDERISIAAKFLAGMKNILVIGS